MADCCKTGKPASGPYEPHGRITTLGKVQVYETGNSAPKHERSRLLLLPDGFGLAHHNILLADAFAEAGWHVVIPDYFEGDPLPIGILRGEISLNFDEKPPEGNKEKHQINLPAWLQRHNHDHVSSLLSDLTEDLKRQDPGLGLFGVGYCFGGKHVLRLAKSTLKAAAAFHPSFVVPEDLIGIQVPLSIGLAEKDEMVPATLAQDFENWSKTILKPEVPFSLQIYSGMGHGFAARPDTEDDDIRREYTKALVDALDFLTKYERV